MTAENAPKSGHLRGRCVPSPLTPFDLTKIGTLERPRYSASVPSWLGRSGNWDTAGEPPLPNLTVRFFDALRGKRPRCGRPGARCAHRNSNNWLCCFAGNREFAPSVGRWRLWCSGCDCPIVTGGPVGVNRAGPGGGPGTAATCPRRSRPMNHAPRQPWRDWESGW